MKLDPRIKSLSDILTCFDAEKAINLIGQKGYFSDDLYRFDDLRYLDYGTLTNVDAYDSKTGAFHRREARSYQHFFIPESSLKPKEKKYRPYTPEEFCGKFQIGEPIKFRNKGDKGSAGYGDLQGLWYKRRDGKMVAYVIIESSGYALDELFEDYEWYDDAAGDWRPFGVEVEE